MPSLFGIRLSLVDTQRVKACSFEFGRAVVTANDRRFSSRRFRSLVLRTAGFSLLSLQLRLLICQTHAPI